MRSALALITLILLTTSFAHAGRHSMFSVNKPNGRKGEKEVYAVIGSVRGRPRVTITGLTKQPYVIEQTQGESTDHFPLGTGDQNAIQKTIKVEYSGNGVKPRVETYRISPRFYWLTQLHMWAFPESFGDGAHRSESPFKGEPQHTRHTVQIVSE